MKKDHDLDLLLPRSIRFLDLCRMERAMKHGGRSFKCFIEQELGRFPLFVIYAFLEWILIIILFVDGTLAFIANEYARFFEMRVPCLLCTRIDHVLVTRSPDFYCNQSICESHKLELSSMAYCHVHGKLADLQGMCESCLLSFAAEKESDNSMYKSLIGILLKDLECFVQDGLHIHIMLPSSRKREDNERFENESSDGRCSCCYETRSTSSRPIVLPRKTLRKSSTTITKAPTPSPRAPSTMVSGDETLNLVLPHIRYMELKESDVNFEDDSMNPITPGTQGMGDYRAASMPLLTGTEDIADVLKTPPFGRGNRFFGIPLSDSANNSPRWGNRASRKSLLDKVDFTTEFAEGNTMVDPADGNSIVNHLKRQVKLDRKSLVALYMELDEERSASAVAANNAMAMITRLQAEKAAVQMEALQYQRMMEEQAEYDQEALQETTNLLMKREEALKALQVELEAYRVKYGYLENEVRDEPPSDQIHEVIQETKTKSNSSSNMGSECGNRSPHSIGEGDDEDDLISLPSEIQFADFDYHEAIIRTEAHS